SPWWRPSGSRACCFACRTTAATASGHRSCDRSPGRSTCGPASRRWPLSPVLPRCRRPWSCAGGRTCGRSPSPVVRPDSWTDHGLARANRQARPRSSSWAPISPAGGRPGPGRRGAQFVPVPSPGVGIRVLIVDDHPVVREGFSQLFEFVDGIDPVGTAANGTDALESVARLAPDVVLLDLQLPGEDGATVAGRIKALHPDVRIVIFTGAPDELAMRRARAAGVDGLLLKTMPVADLIAALREAANGRHVVDRDLAGVLASAEGAEKIGRASCRERGER